VEKQRGMAFGFRKTATAVKKPDRWMNESYRSCQKHESMSLHDFSTGYHLLGVLFITCLKSNLCTARTT
jgi:hypothetical protein